MIDPTGPVLRLDQRKTDADTEKLLTEILTAGTRSVHSATRRLEKEFERLTRAGVPGDKAWRAWASNVYPRRPVGAYEPRGEVFGKGGARTQGMLSWWHLPGSVRAKRGEFLAVPLKAALGTYAGDEITPRRWEGIMKTKLRPWFRPGKTPLLVADGVIDRLGFFIPARRGRAKRRGGQKVSNVRTVPVFALLTEQAHGNRVSLDGAIQSAHAYLEQTYYRRLDRIRV